MLGNYEMYVGSCVGDHSAGRTRYFKKTAKTLTWANPGSRRNLMNTMLADSNIGARTFPCLPVKELSIFTRFYFADMPNSIDLSIS